jgi:aerobic C4-dicarboxylate transport protein
MGSHTALATGDSAPAAKKPFYRLLYVQVLAAIALGAAVGHFAPEFGAALKPLGDGFIKLVKMIIAPVIFVTVATGIAGMRDLKAVGSVAGKAFACRFPLRFDPGFSSRSDPGCW